MPIKLKVEHLRADTDETCPISLCAPEDAHVLLC
jgi:hypothetical protein